MKVKFYLSALLLGGLTIFVWGFIAHMGLASLWETTLSKLPNEQSVVDALKASSTPNGMYYGMQGLFMVVFLGKGMMDTGGAWAALLIPELISDLLAALFLAWLLVRANVRGMSRFALYGGVVGLVGWISGNVSNWIWYNFSFGYVLLEAVDQIIGLMLAGLVIGWLLKRERNVVTLAPTRARVTG